MRRRALITVFCLLAGLYTMRLAWAEDANTIPGQAPQGVQQTPPPTQPDNSPAGLIKHYVPFMAKIEKAKASNDSKKETMAEKAKAKEVKKEAERLAQFKEKYPVHFTIDTEKGSMAGVLYTQEAPITTANFIKLAEDHFYDGLTFHRVERDFVIQTGDPTGTGSGGSPDKINLEINKKLRHDDAGVLGMARTNDPNSASSQFYVTLAPTPFLDDKYAVFGKLTEGVDVARSIAKGDRVIRVTIQETTGSHGAAKP